MLLIYSSNNTPRKKYIFNLFFDELVQVSFRITDDKVQYINATGPKLNYSTNPICSKELFIESCNLLDEKGISEQEIEISTYQEIPIFFSSSHQDAAFPFDLFACSFYLVSRYEEYLPHIKDNLDRYMPENSLAYKNGFLQKPIVNIWCALMIAKLKKAYNDLEIKQNEFKYISTIDIDTAFRYKGKGFVRTIAFFTKSFFRGDFEEMKQAILVLMQKRKDPFDTYSLQFNLQKKYKIDVIYFLLIADYGVNDKNLSYTNRSFQILIKRLSDMASIGIHPSYGSNTDATKLPVEIVRLQNTIKREIVKSRQHFLQLSLPKTYRKLIAQGITDDYTMGYASEMGFRAGIANSFTFYDLDMEQILPIKIHPFSLLDATLKFYKNYEQEKALIAIEQLINEVKSVNGTLISVWHNETFSDYGDWNGWRHVYEEMIKRIVR